MTIRQRSINGDEMRIRPRIDPNPTTGPGPNMPTVGQGGSGPIPSRTIFDRYDVPVLDRAGFEVETRA